MERGAGIRTQLGKLRAWSDSICDVPEGLPHATGGTEPIWRSSADLPLDERGVVVLGIPIGTAEFIARHGRLRLEQESALLARLPLLDDPQCEWLLLRLCAEPRANHLLRAVPPALLTSFAQAHDDQATKRLPH